MTCKLLQDLVTHQAEARPDGIAIVDGSRTVTYGDLERTSNQLAHLLVASGCSRGDRVGLFLPKSADAVLGMIGSLKAGCVYVPIDVTSPPARLGKILESCAPKVILAQESTRQLVQGAASAQGGNVSIPVVWLDAGGSREGSGSDFTRGDLLAAEESHVEAGVSAEDPAHILFTSGSTGTPKGVPITHANVLHFIDWTHGYFQPGSDERVSGHSPFFFDLSTFDIYGAFKAGSELHLVPQQMNLLPHKLAEFIRERELTQWFSVPSILSYMSQFDVVKQDDFPGLRRLLWCGEVFPTPHLRYWMGKLPAVRFTNLYGPTEATIASSYHTVAECPSDDRAEIPIGRPCAGEELLVLDKKLEPVPRGATGDLFIVGCGLSPGYWNDPEKTAEAFVTHPSIGRMYRTGDLAKTDAEGLVYYLGRADSQIKSRGFRIELGEIDTALHSLTDELRESAVVAIPTEGFEGHTICCAFVPRVEGTTPVQLRKALRALLPTYMIPSRWRSCDALPKTPNGKIDRRRLREEFAREAAGAAGR